MIVLPGERVNHVAEITDDICAFEVSGKALQGPLTLASRARASGNHDGFPKLSEPLLCRHDVPTELLIPCNDVERVLNVFAITVSL
jgi:hypothetical protein